MKDFFVKYNLFIIVLIVYVFFHFYTPYFSTSFNLLTLAREGAELGIICIAVTLVLILGRLDISVGSIMAVSAMIMILGFKSFEIHWIILIFVCIFFGFIVGLVNGFLSAVVGIPSFIATLGTLIMLRGLLQWAAATKWMRDAQFMFSEDEGFLFIGNGDLLGIIPLSLFVMIIIFILVFLTLNFTKIGTSIYAIGGNFQSALRAGIRVKIIEIGVFALVGICSAIAGIFLASRLDSVTYQTGQYLEFQVLIAVILGGTSIAGGIGNIWGTILGIALIAILNNGMVMMAIDRDIQDIIIAIFLLFALFTDKYLHNIKSQNSNKWKFADMYLLKNFFGKK